MHHPAGGRAQAHLPGREAMGFLFDPGERTHGLLDPVQAVGDACEELRSHELALMAGMRAAIAGALRHFDPPALERALHRTSFSFASRKARLWNVFVAQHEELARSAGGFQHGIRPRFRDRVLRAPAALERRALILYCT